MEQPKFIHLLYVPTMACNMQCKYCYLEDNTKDEDAKYTPIETLKYAVDKLKKDNKKKTTKKLKDIFIGENKKLKILGTILSGGFILKVFLIIFH